MKRLVLSLLLTATTITLCGCAQQFGSPKSAYKPKRINKCIELLENNQPISYAASKKAAEVYYAAVEKLIELERIREILVLGNSINNSMSCF